MHLTFLDFFFIFSVSTACLYLFRKLAKRFGLVDKPNERKHHRGAVPLVGGVAICFSVVHYLYFNPILLENNYLYILSISILTIVGALDDRFDVSVKFRIVVQAMVSLIMIQYSGVMLTDLGNLLGFGNLNLGILAIPVTVFAILGAINAFNMVDGIDGLLGGLSLVTFASIAILMHWTGQPNKLYISLLFIASIIPFVLMNLGVLGRKRKIFMGDAGSMMIGFTVIWLLLGASQPHEESVSISPVTCLWLIAVPLMDMVSIIYRRIKTGRSPFKPDRDHIHHILQKNEFSSLSVLLIICVLAAALATIGVLGEILHVPDYLMFVGFLTVFVAYHFILSRLSKESLIEVVDTCN